jgi:hypothetical protein
VLDDADEVRAGGRAGHAEVAFAEPVQLPQQRVAIGLEIVPQRSLGLFQIAHGISLGLNLGFRLRATRNGHRNSASEARKNLFPLIEKVNEDRTPIEITSRRGEAGLHPIRLGGLHLLARGRPSHPQAPKPPDRGRAWSRRISEEHRLVYLVDGDDLVVLQARFHYK